MIVEVIITAKTTIVWCDLPNSLHQWSHSLFERDADINITLLVKNTMIYVGVGSEDNTDAKNAKGILNIVVTQK